MTRFFTTLVLVFAAVVRAWGAEAYPSEPINLILPNAAGGTAQIIAQIIAPKITAITRQPVIILPKPGGSGSIAASFVANSKPDGHTVLMGFSSTHSINATTLKKLSYDPIKDFKPVTLIGKAPHFLYVRADLPVNSLAELIAFDKANPGKINIGATGRGDPSNFETVWMNVLAGTSFTVISYRGMNEVASSLMAGQIDGMLAAPITGAEQVRLGRFKILGTSYGQREARYPDIPAIAETLPGFEWSIWQGLLVPAGTPDDRVQALYEIMLKVLADPEVQEKISILSVEAQTQTPAEFAAFIKSETDKVAHVAKISGMTPE